MACSNLFLYFSFSSLSRGSINPRDGNIEFVESKDDDLSDLTSSREAVAGRLVNLDSKNEDPICFSASLKVRNTDVADQLDYKLVVVNKFGNSSGVVSLKVNV